ncbi:hypothetical protein [Rhodococcus jostii]|uniref:hypothetical protein n=1 Tax=Rhodococcus jostii TaxID=132919 RepID=UPI003626D95C
MLDGRRGLMQPMAQRLRVDHQQLQQFSGHLAVGCGAGAENAVPPGVRSDRPGCRGHR